MMSHNHATHHRTVNDANGGRGRKRSREQRLNTTRQHNDEHRMANVGQPCLFSTLPCCASCVPPTDFGRLRAGSEQVSPTLTRTIQLELTHTHTAREREGEREGRNRSTAERGTYGDSWRPNGQNTHSTRWMPALLASCAGGVSEGVSMGVCVWCGVCHLVCRCDVASVFSVLHSSQQSRVDVEVKAEQVVLNRHGRRRPVGVGQVTGLHRLLGRTWRSAAQHTTDSST